MSKFFPPDLNIAESIEKIHQDMVRKYMDLASEVYREYKLDELFNKYGIAIYQGLGGWCIEVEGCDELIEPWQNKRYSEDGTTHGLPEGLDPVLVELLDDILMDVFCQALPGDPSEDLGDYIAYEHQLRKQTKEQG